MWRQVAKARGGVCGLNTPEQALNPALFAMGARKVENRATESATKTTVVYGLRLYRRRDRRTAARLNLGVMIRAFRERGEDLLVGDLEKEEDLAPNLW